LSYISYFDSFFIFNLFPLTIRQERTMKRQLKPLVISLCLSGLISAPAFAKTPPPILTTPQGAISPVQAEDQVVAPQPNKTHKHKHKTTNSSVSSTSDAVPANVGPGVISTPADKAASKKLSGPDAYVNHTSTSEHIGSVEAVNLPIDVDVPGQSFVSSGPYIGIPLVYSGSNLIINSPNINEDVALLNIRKSIRQRLALLGREEAEDHAHLLLSGIVEAQALYKDPGAGPTSSDIDLTASELDGYVLGPSSWTSALFALAYDNGIGPQEGAFNNNSREESSRVFINKAFIVIGDFSKSPLYSSFGQMYVPFGTYSTNLVSTPMTRTMARLQERAFLIGFQQQSQDSFYGAGYIFRGDSHAGSTSRLDNGGFNLGYRFVAGNYSGNFGGGVVANLADSQGMQNNGNGSSGPNWGGFGAVGGYGNEMIAKRVPALNLRGLFSIGSTIDLLAEYVGALTSFSQNDLTYNSHGAKPQAMDFEAAYTFTAFDRPTSIALGYARTKDALALELSAQRYSIVLNTSWWKDTLQSLEYRHDQNYAASAYATGGGTSVTSLINGTGKPDNTVTAQFDIYF
jgi:hypothetical protein